MLALRWKRLERIEDEYVVNEQTFDAPVSLLLEVVALADQVQKSETDLSVGLSL